MFFDTHQTIFLAARREAASKVEAPPLAPPDEQPDTTAAQNLAEILGREIDNGLVRLRDDPNSITVIIPQNVLFQSASTELAPGAPALLEKIAAVAEDASGTILIAGHTDNVPIRNARFRNNLDLSLSRAREVRDVMAQTMTQPDRLLAEGRGETEPIADNSTASGRAKNRRVEIIMRKAS